MSYTEEEIPTKLWGEYENHDEENNCDISIESVNQLIEQAMQPDVLRNVPVNDNPSKITLQIGNERILNTIELQQYYSKITDLQEKFGKQLISELEPAPPKPEIPKPIDEKYRRNCFNFIPKFNSDFVDGAPIKVPEIDKKSSRVALRRSILLILAQIGYTEIWTNTLDTFIDAVDQYYKIMTKNIRAKMDSAFKGRPSQFSDIYNHVFHDMGIGSLTTLHDYYQHQVIEFESELYKKCIKARKEYMVSLNSKRKPQKQKNEEDIIPVLHVPDNSDNAGYIDTSLYNLIPDVEVFLDQNSLINLDTSMERQTQEENTEGYFDVNDLGNFCP